MVPESLVPESFRLGTRGSQLALWQANAVASRISAAGGPSCRIVTVRTTGDRLQDMPLAAAGGKRLFVKEIEDSLLRGDVDLAVHSSKDIPAALPAGLTIAGVLPREDPLDAVVLPLSRTGNGLRLTSIDDLVALLGQAPSFGTSSMRRIAQLTRIFPNARFTPIRGNLDTRLRKLDEGLDDRRNQGGNDALVLAAAGLRRLGCAERISMTLPATACVPAPGQGIIAIETRAGDHRARELVGRIDDGSARAALIAERAVVEGLGGDCQTPIGALATPIDELRLELLAAVIAPDGSRVVRGHAQGTRDDAAGLGAEVARQLLAGGAAEILAEVGVASRRPAPSP